jgi:lipid-A-disaccharide synthase-like uncharacterized protein
MKWEPAALMVLVLAIGVWLVMGPHGVHKRDGAQYVDFQVGSQKGIVEWYQPAGAAEPKLQVKLRGGFESPEMTPVEFRKQFGEEAYRGVAEIGSNFIFRWTKTTSWGSVAWFTLGMAGQIAFAGRMIVQWFVSEKTKQSIVPPVFWWLSLVGGLAVFTYFVWRQDVVGVLGQCSGIVVYARNLKLIAKNKRRTEREALAATANVTSADAASV